MKKFTEWVQPIREAEQKQMSELQKSYREYFGAKLNKFGAKSPSDLTAEQKAEFFNEIKKDWEAGSGAKPAGKKDVEEHGVKESEDFEMNEGVFYRLPRKMIENELWVVAKDVQNFFSRASAGVDCKPEELDSIIKNLEKIKKAVKKFSSREEVSGTVYEAEGFDMSDDVNESEVNYTSDKFALVFVGGSIGQRASTPIFVKGQMGSVSETGNDKEVLKEKAARLRKQLSAGERKYYGMNYTVIELTPSKVKEIDYLKSQQQASNADSVEESEVFESEVKNAKDFEEYAMALLKKKHGDDFDEAKAKKTISGISAAAEKDGDWGAAVGKLQNS